MSSRRVGVHRDLWGEGRYKSLMLSGQKKKLCSIWYMVAREEEEEETRQTLSVTTKDLVNV